jgi:hypothetical protein
MATTSTTPTPSATAMETTKQTNVTEIYKLANFLKQTKHRDPSKFVAISMTKYDQQFCGHL